MARLERDKTLELGPENGTKRGKVKRLRPISPLCIPSLPEPASASPPPTLAALPVAFEMDGLRLDTLELGPENGTKRGKVKRLRPISPLCIPFLPEPASASPPPTLAALPAAFEMDGLRLDTLELGPENGTKRGKVKRLRPISPLCIPSLPEPASASPPPTLAALPAAFEMDGLRLDTLELGPENGTKRGKVKRLRPISPLCIPSLPEPASASPPPTLAALPAAFEMDGLRLDTLELGPENGTKRGKVKRLRLISPLCIPSLPEPASASPPPTLAALPAAFEMDRLSVSARSLEKVREIGRGRYGTVDLMKVPNSDVTMAVKRIRESNESQELKYLDREVRACLHAATSPFLVNCFGVMRLEGDVWICMEVMDSSLDRFYQICEDTQQQLPYYLLAKLAYAVSASE